MGSPAGCSFQEGSFGRGECGTARGKGGQHQLLLASCASTSGVPLGQHSHASACCAAGTCSRVAPPTREVSRLAPQPGLSRLHIHLQSRRGKGWHTSHCLDTGVTGGARGSSAARRHPHMLPATPGVHHSSCQLLTRPPCCPPANLGDGIEEAGALVDRRGSIRKAIGLVGERLVDAGQLVRPTASLRHAACNGCAGCGTNCAGPRGNASSHVWQGVPAAVGRGRGRWAVGLVPARHVNDALASLPQAQRESAQPSCSQSCAPAAAQGPTCGCPPRAASPCPTAGAAGGRCAARTPRRSRTGRPPGRRLPRTH